VQLLRRPNCWIIQVRFIVIKTGGKKSVMRFWR
jgi:hypothetical protein